jgi:hypothetical protein
MALVNHPIKGNCALLIKEEKNKNKTLKLKKFKKK